MYPLGTFATVPKAAEFETEDDISCNPALPTTAAAAINHTNQQMAHVLEEMGIMREQMRAQMDLVAHTKATLYDIDAIDTSEVASHFPVNSLDKLIVVERRLRNESEVIIPKFRILVPTKNIAYTYFSR